MIVIHPAPGYVLGRYSQGDEKSPGGIIIPSGAMRRPVIRIMADGGRPVVPSEKGEDWVQPPDTAFRIEEGVEVVIVAAEQMIEIGHDKLFLVPYRAIIASIENKEAWL